MAWHLDVPTLIFALNLLLVVVTLAQIALYFVGLRYPSSRIFVFAYVALSIGVVGSFFRDIVPMPLSVVLSNAGLSGFLLLLHRGLAHLTDQPRRHVSRDIGLVCLLVAVQLALLADPGTLPLRVIIYSGVGLVIMIQTIRMLLHVKEEALRPIIRYQMAGISFLALVGLVRIIMAIVDPPSSLVDGNITLVSIFGSVFTFVILNTVGNLACMAIKNELALERAATLDPLTQTQNRRALSTIVEREMSRRAANRGALSVLVLDLDHFKAVNDRYGHKTGDDVLRAVAGRVRDCIGTFDTLARLGGEEFLVLLPERGRLEAEWIAQAIRAAVREQPLVQRSPDGIRITISIGGATISGHDDTTWAGLFEQADEALYAAKAAGRDRVVFVDDPPGRERRRGPQDRRQGRGGIPA